jgi:hypothetical protein
LTNEIIIALGKKRYSLGSVLLLERGEHYMKNESQEAV